MSTPPRPDRAAQLERLHLDILSQPDDVTCGPTCLHAIYRYWGDELPITQVVDEVGKMPSGGTADVFLALHAQQRGYRCTIHTFNLRIFDPSWFLPGVDMRARLRAQSAFKTPQRPVFGLLTDAYVEFLARGGTIRLADPRPALIRRYLRRGVPILTGLSSTYLYRTEREYGPDDEPDDVRGEPQGHFVVLCGYHRQQQVVLVADPYGTNPLQPGHLYEVSLERAMGAVVLGVLTHDANLLMIEPKKRAVRPPPS